jgi:hypothetical protein
MLRALARRAGGDPDALPQLQAAAMLADELMRHAIDQLRAEGYSWAEIGKRLGMTRQGAQQRYGLRAAS